MIPLQSIIESNIYPLYVLEDRFRPGGFVVGSIWNYEEGYLELTIKDQGMNYFLRIPFYAVAGSLDYPGVTVRVEQPFLLVYNQEQFEREGLGGTASGMLNQIQSPVNSDADIPESYTKIGKKIMKKVEELLLPCR
ncbi:YugN-like family protein [Lentibacillus halodurans]|uniref:YugN-like family protein n=1 Tax=Lentibacillus halodurans TaxID=237679 RepID=A0A1I0WUB1_9BACI|nr:YugN family protein [Lentibacillus halodurans]SFA91606.1 YugN-like family protein [Lentibacillus halodurans]